MPPCLPWLPACRAATPSLLISDHCAAVVLVYVCWDGRRDRQRAARASGRADRRRLRTEQWRLSGRTASDERVHGWIRWSELGRWRWGGTT